MTERVSVCSDEGSNLQDRVIDRNKLLVASQAYCNGDADKFIVTEPRECSSPNTLTPGRRKIGLVSPETTPHPTKICARRIVSTCTVILPVINTCHISQL